MLEEDCEYIGPWDRLQAKVTPIYATLPALLRDISPQQSSATSIDELLARVWRLRGRLIQLEGNVRDILEDSTYVEMVPSQIPDSPFPTRYRYRNMLYSGSLLVYWRVLIIINGTIQRLQCAARHEHGHCMPMQDLESSTLRAALGIGMSAEDGLRWRPVSSLTQIFTIPAAIWAYSGYDDRNPGGCYKMDWLLTMQSAFLSSVDQTCRAVATQYIDAVGLACPSFADFDGLTSDSLSSLKEAQARKLTA